MKVIFFFLNKFDNERLVFFIDFKLLFVKYIVIVLLYIVCLLFLE